MLGHIFGQLSQTLVKEDTNHYIHVDDVIIIKDDFEGIQALKLFLAR